MEKQKKKGKKDIKGKTKIEEINFEKEEQGRMGQ